MDNTRSNSSKVIEFMTNNALIMILIAMVLIVGITRDNFISIANVRNIAINTSVRFVIALGVSGCLITKGTDLSAGRIVGLGACISATLLQLPEVSGKFYPNLRSFPMVGALLIAVFVCCVFGLINGIVISYLQVPPFIATLGMQLIVYGACLVYTGADPLGNFKPSYLNVAKGEASLRIPDLLIVVLMMVIIIYLLFYDKTKHRLGGFKAGTLMTSKGSSVKKIAILIGMVLVAGMYIYNLYRRVVIKYETLNPAYIGKSIFVAKSPYLFLIALILGLFMYFLYNKTRHGKFMYAIGGNENAAEVSGVNVKKSKIIIYTLAAALYAVAGFLLASKAGGATVNMGQGYELEAIAACTIGGVSTNGGVGRVSGILIGVLIFELLKSSLQFMKVNTSYQYIVQGLVIVVAVALDLRKYLAKK